MLINPFTGQVINAGNCGIGSGGFKPGNKCAKGKGGGGKLGGPEDTGDIRKSRKEKLAAVKSAKTEVATKKKEIKAAKSELAKVNESIKADKAKVKTLEADLKAVQLKKADIDAKIAASKARMAALKAKLKK